MTGMEYPCKHHRVKDINEKTASLKYGISGMLPVMDCEIFSRIKTDFSENNIKIYTQNLHQNESSGCARLSQHTI